MYVHCSNTSFMFSTVRKSWNTSKKSTTEQPHFPYKFQKFSWLTSWLFFFFFFPFTTTSNIIHTARTISQKAILHRRTSNNRSRQVDRKVYFEQKKGEKKNQNQRTSLTTRIDEIIWSNRDLLSYETAPRSEKRKEHPAHLYGNLLIGFHVHETSDLTR